MLYSAILATCINLLLLFDVGLARSGLCSVYEPFRVSPESATSLLSYNKEVLKHHVQFQIGGPFALHTEDCVLIKPDSVQEFIAIQWALTHWNQNPNNNYFKLAMQAGDTCSRRRETVSQVVDFLQSAGFYEAKECQDDIKNTPSFLGLIAPKDASSSDAVASILSPTPIPLVTYSASSVNVMKHHNLTQATVVTTPTLEHYFELIVGLVKGLNSDLVNFVYSNIVMTSPEADALHMQLVDAGIAVRQFMPLSQPQVLNKLRFSAAKINIVASSKAEMVYLMQMNQAKKMEKVLWIYVPVSEERLHSIEVQQILPSMETGSTVVVLQERALQIPEFRDYFLDILHNNYHAYSLFAGYVQQVYNCTLTGTAGFVPCKDLTANQMQILFVQSPKVQSAILATYVLAELGKRIAQSSRSLSSCMYPSAECTQLATAVLEQMEYTFEDFDPSIFTGFKLSLQRSNQGFLTVQGLAIEAFQVTANTKGVSMIKVAELATGAGVTLSVENFSWYNGLPVKSICDPTSSQCKLCTTTVDLNSPTHSVSLPDDYDLYIMGLFDLHSGPNCDKPVQDRRQITLPMAFLHSLWTIKQRYSSMNLLPNVELGAVVVDNCDDPMKAFKIVHDATTQCLKVNTVGAETIIHPENIIGFVSGGSEGSQAGVRVAFPTDTKTVKPPLVSISRNQRKYSPYKDFSTYPDYTMQAEAIVDLLRKFNWNFVSILLSDGDQQSLQAYKEFEKLANKKKICIADTVKLSGGDIVEMVSKEGSSSPSADVALVFANADDTALFIRSYKESHKQNGQMPLLVFTGDAHNWRYSKVADDDRKTGWKRKPLGAISIQPHTVLRSEFSDWLDSITVARFPEPWFQRFIEDNYQCSYSTDSPYKTKCTGEEGLKSSAMGRMNDAGYLVSGMEALIFATDAIYKKLCPQQKGLCPAFMRSGSGWKQVERLLEAVPKIDSFQLYNYRLMEQGELKTEYSLMGNWSATDRLHLSYPWVGMDVSSNSVSSIPPQSTCNPPLCKCELDDDFFTKPLQVSSMDDLLMSSNSFESAGRVTSTSNQWQNVAGLGPDPVVASLPSLGWKQQTWTYIFLVVNSLLLLLALAVLLLVVFKMYQRVVKGNQSLGICLLCGVVLLYTSAYFYIFDPSEIVCRLRYFTHSLAYAVCFGCMIAKAMQLRNSETLGYNGYITYWNYWLLLFFITGVQLALNLQWLLMRQPVHMHVLHAIQSRTITYSCSWSRDEFLLSHSYVVVLLFVALILALTNRGVKRNYKETKWLMYTAVLCLPLWAVWMTAFKLAPQPFQEVVIVMELIACATVILSFMFGPKVYILLSYEAVLIEYPAGYNKQSQNPDPIKDVEGNDDLGRIHLAGAPSVDLFDPPRAVSPAGSSTASTKSTIISHRNTTSSEDGESSPIFQQLFGSYQSTLETQLTNSMVMRLRPANQPNNRAVVRKKSRSKRIKADQEKNERSTMVVPTVMKTASVHRKQDKL